MDPTNEPSPEEPESRLERVAFALVREPLYLPVTFAVAAHLALVIAVTLIYFVREARYLLAPLLLAEAWLTVRLARSEVKDLGKPGPLAVWLGVTWILAGALSWWLFDWL